MATPKERIDVLLVQRGLADSRTLAQALVMEGRVTVEGRRADKPGERVETTAQVAVAGPPRPFVSRGGAKLAAALGTFGIDVTGAIALDVGAGTGGFTHCLLQRGATRVYAVDVGHGQFDHGLRTDPRVVTIERLNARFLSPSDLPGPVDVAVMDVSFISANLILPRIPPLMRGRDVVVLVKPQFEAGREAVGRGGIVRDPAHWRGALVSVAGGARGCGLSPIGVIPSPVPGAEGNREFLLHLAAALPTGAPEAPDVEIEGLIEAAVAAASTAASPPEEART